ncbi:hypothetical protein A2773_00630 [Candidatus Gottesmanbacteria bacterium RIFCSPHIGHO2_01_FULL_39_10]|uniref:NAD-dependent epimerase/dehydratase domain-containing protein n=1 Tax=Candidatus Gottesmanbacteria bacterium RIFCSPHIGHO2_01_FULL_39_10 TaxID=1798375 RepID=A0A1F5ZMS8_9BACT|nr:MAG: hypothetical protein A2773_00630 [Candidatus Gottesmanbacteria bacterium RIFCSPHIGHO2_01_FULL_39_10]
MSLKIFITGANGFIARNVIEQLGSKYNLVAPSHKELGLSDTRSVDQFFLRHKRFDVVIHTANIGGTRKANDSCQTFLSNLKIFFNIVRNENKFDKLINLGSGAEYGKQGLIISVREKDFDKRVPEDFYGFYKYVCSQLIENHDKFINLRLFAVYGKYEDYQIRFISNAICKSILGFPITINKNAFFDYLYIDDLVKIIDFFINHKTTFRVFNVGRGKATDLLTIAKKINKIALKKQKIIVRNKELGNEYTCDNSRLLDEIRKFKFSDFDKTLEDLYKWYSSIKSNLKKESFYNDYF